LADVDPARVQEVITTKDWMEDLTAALRAALPEVCIRMAGDAGQERLPCVLLSENWRAAGFGDDEPVAARLTLEVRIIAADGGQCADIGGVVWAACALRGYSLMERRAYREGKTRCASLKFERWAAAGINEREPFGGNG
jgi:hypothetical protein